jgi:hypothetical protein
MKKIIIFVLLISVIFGSCISGRHTYGCPQIKGMVGYGPQGVQH